MSITNLILIILSAVAFVITVVMIRLMFLIQEKTITIKEYNTNTSAKLYSIVDQDNNRYLIDKDVFNKGRYIFPNRPAICVGNKYDIAYNKNTKMIMSLFNNDDKLLYNDDKLGCQV